jgi:cytochrome o ubiquinol oxidase subunit 1
VYILILPAFGVFSEVVATFSGKPLFGYRSMVLATMAICVLSFMVWLHHFFTMGAGADVNGFFGIATMIIAIPTGVKVFNWLFTLYGGRVQYTVPLYWTLGFIVTFVIGGMTGVLMAIPPADFVLHNSLFLIAHFHNVVIGGVVFGVMAGMTYWFPKAFGFKLNERLGKAVFWCWFIGFYLAFMPLYALGLMGATRRMQHYPDMHWQPLMLVALSGAVVQIVVSIRQRHANRDRTGDPWNARTLEWSIPSPPPAWNFTRLPSVQGTDAYWHMKEEGTARRALPGSFVDLHLPRNSPIGVFLAFFAVILGFALIWRIYWLAGVGLVGALAVALIESWKTDLAIRVPAPEVEAFEHVHPTPLLRGTSGELDTVDDRVAATSEGRS